MDWECYQPGQRTTSKGCTACPRGEPTGLASQPLDAIGMAALYGPMRGVARGDCGNDGFSSLAVGPFGEAAAALLLFRNSGDRTFTEPASAEGLSARCPSLPRAPAMARDGRACQPTQGRATVGSRPCFAEAARELWQPAATPRLVRAG
jgi:hypothetical protein